MSDFTDFIRDRTTVASILYSLFFMVYLGMLVAITLFPLKWFRRRGVAMALILAAYVFVNLTGESLSQSVERARMASNASALRMFLVATWFGLLFSVVISALKRPPVKKET